LTVTYNDVFQLYSRCVIELVMCLFVIPSKEALMCH